MMKKSDFTLSFHCIFDVDTASCGLGESILEAVVQVH